MRKATVFLALLKAIEIVAVGALLAACTNGRVGTQTYPFGSADSDGDILKAVDHALPPKQRSCPLKLLTPYDSWMAAETAKEQIVMVDVCGHSRHFSIEHRYVNADSGLIVAKRLD
jgi:hypothetical protein